MGNHLRSRQDGALNHLPGHIRLCRLTDLQDGRTLGFYLKERGGEVAIFLYREADRIFAYENACPHLGAPLELHDHRFLSADGRHFLCSTHGALFDKTSGRCLSGPCVGRSLRALEVECDAHGQIWLAIPGFD